MSKKRRDKDFLGDINEAMDLISLYTKGLTYQKFLEKRGQVHLFYPCGSCGKRQKS